MKQYSKICKYTTNSINIKEDKKLSTFNSSMEYEITSDAEITGILSHFDADHILGLIDDSLQRRNMFYPNNPPNLVRSLETNFSLMYSNLPDSKKEDIDDVRESIYKAIIDKLCLYYNLDFNYKINDIEQDYYTIAVYLYDFLVSSFSKNIISFFTNYILKEKDYLYNHVGLIEMKKSKDMSMSYAKKLHKDSKLAVINANLEYVVDSIGLFDISLSDLLNLLYPSNIAELIWMSISPKGNLFRDHFIGSINNEYKPVFLTNIKFSLLEYDNSGLTAMDAMTETI